MSIDKSVLGEDTKVPKTGPPNGALVVGFIQQFSTHSKHFTLNSLFTHITLTLVVANCGATVVLQQIEGGLAAKLYL